MTPTTTFCLTKALDIDLLFCAIQKTLWFKCGSDGGAETSDAGWLPGESL